MIIDAAILGALIWMGWSLQNIADAIERGEHRSTDKR